MRIKPLSEAKKMLLNLLERSALNPLNWQNIKPTFTILWQGLLAIFVVIGLIIIAVKLVSFVVNKAEKLKTAREDAKNAADVSR